MGTISDKLNSAYALSDTYQAVSQVRVALQNLKNVAAETKSTIDALTSGNSFAGVDQELKVIGASCIAVVDSLNTAFADVDRAEFIDFTPTQV